MGLPIGIIVAFPGLAALAAVPGNSGLRNALPGGTCVSGDAGRTREAAFVLEELHGGVPTRDRSSFHCVRRVVGPNEWFRGPRFCVR